MSWEVYRRLEPLPPHGDLQRGFAAEVADPLWVLARQWELGEHAGEDAGAPTVVSVLARRTPMGEVAGQDPSVVPAEALLEGSVGDWWTVGRRIRVGRAVTGALSAEQRAAHAFGALPAPYGDTFAGEVDGLAAWRDGLVPDGHPALAGLADRPDFWNGSTLRHDADIPAGGATLQVRGHGGGEVDWYTADAVGKLGEGAVPDDPAQVVPLRLQYPGAPLPRWWQIEDHAVDIGGFPPDRTHLATALLIELIAAHAGDWFVFPVPAPPPGDDTPGVGVVVTLASVRVRDTFDDSWDLALPPGAGEGVVPDGPAGPWSLFRTTGLDRASLVLWPTAATPLTGSVLDDVVLAVDEDANLLWGVELTAGGLPQLADAENAAALADGQRTGTREFEWRPSTTLPPHWYPYRIETRSEPAGAPPRRAFVQGLVAELGAGTRDPSPPPRSELIGGGADGHLLETFAVPNAGLRLARNYALARDTDGRPVLWRQRRRVPLLAGPQSHLRFDVLREAPPP